MVHEVTADRLTGILIGAACADALGAGYEFGAPVPASTPVTMRRQGSFEPGEWTDDTAQLLAIAMVAAEGVDLRTVAGEDAVAARLQEWYLSPARLKDIGIHSAAVFGEVATLPTPGSPSGSARWRMPRRRDVRAAVAGTGRSCARQASRWRCTPIRQGW